MNSPATSILSRTAPILGAGLVVAALGTLVWALAEGSGRSRPAQGIAPEVRGAPIRSAVPKPSPDEPPAAATAATPPKSAQGQEFEELTFAVLSDFDYPKTGSMQVGRSADPSPGETSEEGPIESPRDSKIPADVRAFDGKRVMVTGFMNPLEFDGDGVKSFALTAIPGGCCYGAIPRLNEWIVVQMPGDERAEYAYYDPVTIYGEISIGELYDEGTVLSLYRMTPEQIDVGY